MQFNKYTHTHTHTVSLIPPWEDQRDWHRMTTMTVPGCAVMYNVINTHTHAHTHPPWEDQCEWHIMTRMTGPDCAVMCNLINTHTHTHTGLLSSFFTAPSLISRIAAQSDLVMSYIAPIKPALTTDIRVMIQLKHQDQLPDIALHHAIHYYSFPEPFSICIGPSLIPGVPAQSDLVT